MRDIKFRAWHEKSKRMIDWRTLFCEYTAHSIFMVPSEFSLTLMQFTGLRDKNGKEIFEGDIVRWGNSSQYSCGVVIYEGYNFCVSNILHSTDDDRMYFNHSDSFEVIGNKFENPELLGGVS